jgi:hypothetical protein
LSRTIALTVLAAPLIAFFAYLALAADPSVPATQPVEPADNSYCLTCHMNFKNEKLAAQHQVAGVGCDQCHGPSEKHSSDEDGIIPPDVMFPKDRITSSCASCHKTDVLEKDGGHTPLLSGKAVEPLRYCTDCHGLHVMAHRTRRWDKVSRKLISDDGVRMLTQPDRKP